MIVVRSPLIIFQGLYIGFDFFRFVEDGQIAVYAGEGRDGEVLFEYSGKFYLYTPDSNQALLIIYPVPRMNSNKHAWQFIG